MELREYLFKERITITEFAKLIDYCRGHISQIVVSHRRPSRRLAKIIENVTDGKVKYEDMLTLHKDVKKQN